MSNRPAHIQKAIDESNARAKAAGIAPLSRPFRDLGDDWQAIQAEDADENYGRTQHAAGVKSLLAQSVWAW